MTGPGQDMVPMQRNRMHYAVGMIVVTGTGLLWRSGLIPLPAFLSKYGGDALWALAVFCVVGLVLPRKPTGYVAIIALGCAWAVEFLQLYHAPWIEGVRATRLGRLALGTTFHSPDLLAYLVGVACGALGESLFCLSNRTTPDR